MQSYIHFVTSDKKLPFFVYFFDILSNVDAWSPRRPIPKPTYEEPHDTIPHDFITQPRACRLLHTLRVLKEEMDNNYKDETRGEGSLLLTVFVTESLKKREGKEGEERNVVNSILTPRCSHCALYFIFGGILKKKNRRKNSTFGMEIFPMLKKTL